MTEIAAITSMTFNADNKTGLNGLLSPRPLPGVEMKVTEDDRFFVTCWKERQYLYKNSRNI